MGSAAAFTIATTVHFNIWDEELHGLIQVGRVGLGQVCRIVIMALCLPRVMSFPSFPSKVIYTYLIDLMFCMLAGFFSHDDSGREGREGTDDTVCM